MASQLFIDRFKDKVSTMNKLGEFNVDTSKAVNKPAGMSQKSIMQISASNIIKSNYQTSVSPTGDYPTFARPIKLQGTNERSFYAPPSEAATEPHDIYLMNAKNSYYPAPENVSHGYSAQQSPRVSEIHQKPKKAASAAPLRKTQETMLSTNSNQSLSHAKRRVIDFTPYTLKDYKIIKTEKYYELGGLGPFNIGTEEWEKKKELQDRKKEYAKQVMQANSTLIPPAVLKKPKEKDKEISSRQRAIEFAKKIPKPPLKAKVFNSEIKEEKEEFEDKTLSWLENLEKQHELYKNKAQEIRTKME